MSDQSGVEQATETTEQATVSNSLNPHRLPLQILGICISSVIVTLIGGLFIVPVGIFVFADAWVAGIYKKKESQSFLNISPMAWGIVVQGLFIVGFPLYLVFRNRLKTKSGSLILFILTILSGVAAIALLVLAVLIHLARIQGHA